MVQSAFVSLPLCIPFFYTHFPVYDSQNFAAGFFGVPDFLTSYRQLITIEDPSGTVSRNNTLAVQCANTNGIAGGLGGEASSAWMQIYLSNATERINGMVEGLEFEVGDVLAMQQACAYEVGV